MVLKKPKNMVLDWQGDYLSIAGPIDRGSIRAHSHGDEIGALAEEASIASSQGTNEQADARSKSETDLAASTAASLGPVKGKLDPSDPRFIEREVQACLPPVF